MPTIWTLGHSTRDWPAFLAILRHADLRVVADVRRFAASRRHPQYHGAAMARALGEAGMDYVPMPDLGGRREPCADSPHTSLK